MSSLGLHSLIGELFVPTFLVLALIHLLMLLLLVKRDFSLFGSLAISSVPLLLMAFLFLQRASENGVKWYGEIMPLSILVTLLVTEFMFLSSIRSYFENYSKTEGWLSVFYSTFLVNWLVIFIDYSFTIGTVDPLSNWFVQFAGATMLNLALAEALAIYFVGKYMFYPDYRYVSVIEPVLFLLYGIMMGLNWGALLNGVFITPEPFHTYGLFLPSPLWAFGLLNALFVIIPQFLVAFYGRKYAQQILTDRKLLSSLDPYLLPRIRWIGRATYIFAVGVTTSFLILFIPFQLNVEFVASLGPWIAASMFITVSAIFYLAFQSPETLRKILSK